MSDNLKVLASSDDVLPFSDGLSEGYNISIEVEENASEAYVHILLVNSKLEVKSLNKLLIDRSHHVEISTVDISASNPRQPLGWSYKHVKTSDILTNRVGLPILRERVDPNDPNDRTSAALFDAKLSRLLHSSQLNGSKSSCGFIGVSDARGGIADRLPAVSANLDYQMTTPPTVRLSFDGGDTTTQYLVLSSDQNVLTLSPITVNIRDVNVPRWGKKLDLIKY